MDFLSDTFSKWFWFNNSFALNLFRTLVDRLNILFENFSQYRGLLLEVNITCGSKYILCQALICFWLRKVKKTSICRSKVFFQKFHKFLCNWNFTWTLIKHHFHENGANYKVIELNPLQNLIIFKLKIVWKNVLP